MSREQELAQFRADKLEAFTAPITTEKVDAFYEKYHNGVSLTAFCRGRRPNNPKEAEEIFWGSVHKAVTGYTVLPIEQRRESKAWLDARGLQSHDDGDL